jgi:hypothetical protein
MVTTASGQRQVVKETVRMVRNIAGVVRNRVFWRRLLRGAAPSLVFLFDLQDGFVRWAIRGCSICVFV